MNRVIFSGCVLLAWAGTLVGVPALSQTPHPRPTTNAAPIADPIVGTWTGTISKFPGAYGDNKRIMLVTPNQDGSISCIWYIPNLEKTPAKSCKFQEGTLDLMTAADSKVRMKMQPDRSLSGDFRLKNGEWYDVNLKRE